MTRLDKVRQGLKIMHEMTDGVHENMDEASLPILAIVREDGVLSALTELADFANLAFEMIAKLQYVMGRPKDDMMREIGARKVEGEGEDRGQGLPADFMAPPSSHVQ